jgi:hypothetical protein
MSIPDHIVALFPEEQQRDATAINSMEKLRDSLYSKGDTKGAKDINNRIIQAENRISIWAENNPDAANAILTHEVQK